MAKTRTITEYALFGKMDDGLWYKFNDTEIQSLEEAESEICKMKENPLASIFIDYKVMKRTVTFSIEEWSNADIEKSK